MQGELSSRASAEITSKVTMYNVEGLDHLSTHWDKKKMLCPKPHGKFASIQDILRAMKTTSEIPEFSHSYTPSGFSWLPSVTTQQS